METQVLNLRQLCWYIQRQLCEVGLYLGSGLGLVISNRPHVECAASYGLHVYYALILLFVYWI